MDKTSWTYSTVCQGKVQDPHGTRDGATVAALFPPHPSAVVRNEYTGNSLKTLLYRRVQSFFSELGGGERTVDKGIVH